MSGIPVYTNSPINAAKASGPTSQTAAPPTQSTPVAPSSNVATTTATPSSTSSYPAAQPGAPAVPAPTAAVKRYAPVQPTPTVKTDDGPPAPQPGAFPTPTQSLRSNLPPPPKAGETFNPPPQTTTAQTYPPQMSIPPPTTAYGAQQPASSTSTTNAPSSSYPVPLPSEDYGAPRRSLEHPPGYAQNPYASNFSADQRRAQEAQDTPSLGSYGSESKSTTAAFGVDPESVWNTAKKWAQTAGEKISEAEADIWKKVNGEK